MSDSSEYPRFGKGTAKGRGSSYMKIFLIVCIFYLENQIERICINYVESMLQVLDFLDYSVRVLGC